MPDISGVKLCSAVRATKFGAGHHASTAREPRRQCCRVWSGRDDYIAKPYYAANCLRGSRRCCASSMPPRLRRRPFWLPEGCGSFRKRAGTLRRQPLEADVGEFDLLQALHAQRRAWRPRRNVSHVLGHKTEPYDRQA